VDHRLRCMMRTHPSTEYLCILGVPKTGRGTIRDIKETVSHDIYCAGPEPYGTVVTHGALGPFWNSQQRKESYWTWSFWGHLENGGSRGSRIDHGFRSRRMMPRCLIYIGSLIAIGCTVGGCRTGCGGWQILQEKHHYRKTSHYATANPGERKR